MVKEIEEDRMSEETDMSIEEGLLALWLHEDGICGQDCEYCRRDAEDTEYIDLN